MANVISLNVGGKIFATTVGTLREATKLAHYFKDTSLNPFDDEDSRRNETVFIDRDPTYFPLLLKYLREGKVRLSMSARELEGLREDAEFYGVLPLADLLRLEEGRREPFFIEDKVVWRDSDLHRLCSDMGIRFDGTTEKLPICFNPCRGRYGDGNLCCPWCEVKFGVSRCIFNYPREYTQRTGHIVKLKVREAQSDWHRHKSSHRRWRMNSCPLFHEDSVKQSIVI